MKISKPFLIFLIIICLYLFFIGVSPVKVKIIPTDMAIQAQIYRRSILPPFNNVGDFIPNLKQAVITTEEQTKYRVELIDYQGYSFPITLSYSPVYDDEKKLQDNINYSIRNRKSFTYTTYPYFLLIFVIFPLIIFAFILRMKYYKVQRQRYKKKSEQHRKDHKIHTLQQKQLPVSEKQKYKNINDSIIK